MHAAKLTPTRADFLLPALLGCWLRTLAKALAKDAPALGAFSMP